MKRIKFMSFTLFVLFTIVSCSESDIPESTIVRKMNVELFQQNPQSKNTNGNKSKEDGFLKVIVENEESDIINFELSDNLINFIGIPKGELYSKIYDALDVKGYGTKKYASKNAKEKSDYRKCIDACNDKYTDEDGGKIRGRGWCKAGCFGQAIIDAIVVVIPSIVAELIK